MNSLISARDITLIGPMNPYAGRILFCTMPPTVGFATVTVTIGNNRTVVPAPVAEGLRVGEVGPGEMTEVSMRLSRGGAAVCVPEFELRDEQWWEEAGSLFFSVTSTAGGLGPFTITCVVMYIAVIVLFGLVPCLRDLSFHAQRR